MSKLSNCYTPLPADKPLLKINASSRPSGTLASQVIDDAKTANYSRSSSSLRRVCISRNILSSSTGSSIVEIGHTKVICSVHGPRPVTSSSLGGLSGVMSEGTSQDSGVLNSEVRYANFGIMPEILRMTSPMNLDGYFSNPNMNQIETELSNRLNDTLRPAIPLHLLKKNVVDVFVMVLQDDGGVFVASVIAASLALVDAGVECFDLISGFTVAVVPRNLCMARQDDHEEANADNTLLGDYQLLADPDEKEILISSGIITLAMMIIWKDVVFWDQVGSLPPDVAEKALELAKEGCCVVHKLMKHALLEQDELSDV